MPERETAFLKQPERSKFTELGTDDEKVLRIIGSEKAEYRGELERAWNLYKLAKVSGNFQGGFTEAHMAYFDAITAPDAIIPPDWEQVVESFATSPAARPTSPIAAAQTFAEPPLDVTGKTEPSPVIEVSEPPKF